MLEYKDERNGNMAQRSLNPATGEVVAEFDEHTEDEAAGAVAAAARSGAPRSA